MFWNNIVFESALLGDSNSVPHECLGEQMGS